MKVTLKPTTKTAELNGVEARLWEGQTEGGIRITAFITRIAVDAEDSQAFEKESGLERRRAPSAEAQVFPLRMVL